MSDKRTRKTRQERHAKPTDAAPGASNDVASGGFRLDSFVLWVLFPLAIVAAIVFVAVRPIADPDLWFHMALGREVVERGILPKGDIFSDTAPGREWISSGWFSSVILYRLFEWGGPGGAGVLAMVAGVFAATHLTVYFTALVKHGARLVVPLALLAGVLMSYGRMTPRPDVWSQLFVVLVLLTLLAGDRALRRAPERPPLVLWLLPFLIAAWANFHAGYLAGLVVIAIFSAAVLFGDFGISMRRRIIALIPCALCGVAWIANPYGIRLAALAQKIKDIAGVSETIFEWMPLIYLPGYNLPWPTHVGFGLLMMLMLGVWICRTAPIPRWQLGAAIFFVAFALYQRRQVGPLSVALPLLLAAHATGLENLLRRGGRWLLVTPPLLAASIATMQYQGVLEMGQGWPSSGRMARTLPVSVTDFLTENRPPAKIFNSYGQGGYLLYHLAPQTKVFIDGRLDVYDKETWADYLAIEENRLSIDDAVKKYGINAFVMDIEACYGFDLHLANRLTKRPDWALVFFDDSMTVFVRRVPEAQALIATQEYRFLSPYDPNRTLQALKNPANVPGIQAELARAQRDGAGSANALALTAFCMAESGMPEEASGALQQAFARDPNSSLAINVALRLQSQSRNGGRPVGPWVWVDTFGK